MDQRDQAQALATGREIGLRLLPSGSFFGRPHQYTAAQDGDGLVYIRLPMRDWEKIVREATTNSTAAERVQDVAIEKGRLTETADGKRIIDLHLAA